MFFIFVFLLFCLENVVLRGLFFLFDEILIVYCLKNTVPFFSPFLIEKKKKKKNLSVVICYFPFKFKFNHFFFCFFSPSFFLSSFDPFISKSNQKKTFNEN